MVRLPALLTLVAFAFVLAGCGHMPVMSMVKLARIDFRTTDPAQFRNDRNNVAMPHITLLRCTNHLCRRARRGTRSAAGRERPVTAEGMPTCRRPVQHGGPCEGFRRPVLTVHGPSVLA